MAFLEFCLNSYPICIICLDCQKVYGQNCTCQAREVKWKKRKIDRDYVVDFCHKPLTQKGATNQKVLLNSEFVRWLFSNVSQCIEISSFQNDVNVCKSCMSRYRGKNKGILLLISLIYTKVILKSYLLKYKK